MRGIISAFADQSIQNELKRDIENQDMAFMCDDCTNGVTLVMDVERHSDVDVIIMRYTAIKDIETYIAQIRAITKTARILLILSGLRKQYVQTQFDVYRKQYNVEDIIFEGKGMDKFEILSIINKGRINEAAVSDEIILDDISKSQPVKTEKSAESETIKKVESKPKVNKRKQPIIDFKWKRRNTVKSNKECLIISVFGTTHGAGVTNMTASLAEYFSENGKKVLAINLSGGDEFRYIHGRAEYKNVKSVDISEFNDYDIVVIDLGNPFYIDSNGDFCGISSGYNYKNIEILKISSLKIVMALSDAWHINKCKYFLLDEKWAEQISNSYIFLFDTEPPKQLLKYNVNMFDRNSDSFAKEIARLFL